MKKFIITFFIMIFGVTLTCGGVLLLSTGIVVEETNKEDVSNENNNEKPNPDDDVEQNATTEFDWTIRILYFASSTGVKANASSTEDTAGGKGYFTMQWADENFKTGNITGTRSQYAANGKTMEVTNSKTSNAKYMHYDYWNILPYHRLIVLDVGYGNNSSSAYFFGVQIGDSNSTSRSTSSTGRYFIYDSSYITRDQNTATSGCTTWLKGDFYCVFRERYTCRFNLNGGSGVSTSKYVYGGIGYSLVGAPSKTGYVFKGWSHGGTMYSSYASIPDSMANTNREFTANWEPASYSIMLDANGGTLPTISSVSVTQISGYAFSYSASTGYYESQNFGVANSYALCRVNFYAQAGSVFILNVVNFAESSFDYGIFSNLNSTLSSSNTADTTNVYRSFSGESSSMQKNVEYNITSSGSYYIYVKYRKDGSVDKNNDSLRFKIGDNGVDIYSSTSTSGFSLNSAGYYESNNKGIHNSYAMTSVSFTANAGENITFQVINYAESNYDFGIFSNLNTSLTYLSTEDTTNVYKSFKGLSSSLVQTVTYNIPTSGYHYVYIKYRKDSSANSNNDSLQFKVIGKKVTFDSAYGTLPTPTKTNYDFAGWYTSSGVRVYNTTTVKTAGKHILQARWEPKIYTLTVNYQSAYLNNSTNLNISAPSCTVSNTSIAHGSVSYVKHSYTTSSYTINLSRANTSYNYYIAIGTTPTTSSAVNSTSYTWTPNQNRTIYVYIYQRYTIGFNGNNYSSGSIPGPYYKIHGTNLSIPSNTLSRTSYTPNGWNTNSQGTGTSYTTVYTGNSSVTLYADWTPIYATVKIQIMTSENGTSYTNSVSGGTINLSYYNSPYNTPTQVTSSILSANLTTYSSVLINYTMTFSPVAKSGYIFKGISTTMGAPVLTTGSPNNQFIPSTASTYTVYAFFNKLSANQLKFSYENDVATTVSSYSYTYPSNGYYGFIRNSAGYYESNNKGIHNSSSLCKVTVTTSTASTLILDVINYAEAGYDFGIFSNLNTSLSNSNVEDTANVFKSFKGSNSSSVQSLSYYIPSGTHYFYVKFRKDGSANSNNDSLQFRVNTGPAISVQNINSFNHGFKQNSSGYYESQNKAIASSFSVVKFSFYLNQVSTLTFDAINYAESCCDFGIFGKLDTSLSLNANVDSSSSVHKSFAGVSSSSIQKVVYEDVPAGSHYIYIKYKKDGSVDSLNDSLQFKLSSVTKKVGYFYFEDGEYPQSYVGDAMNATLTSAITSGKTPEYNLEYNNGNSATNVKIPVYLHTDGNKYAVLTAPRTMTLKLKGGTYTFTHGNNYYFKVEPIRWRVSDYGVMNNQYPTEWANSATYKTYFTAVSDRILSFGAVHNESVAENWAYDTSKLHTSMQTNSSNSSLSFAGTNATVNIDVFGSVGQQDKVVSKDIRYTGIRVASIDEIEHYLNDKRAYASDMVAFYFGIDNDEYLDYWTRNLGSNLNNGQVVTSSNITTSVFLNELKGVRLALTFSHGSRV